MNLYHCDVMMGAMASQITSLTIVYSIVHSDADQIKNQSTASLAFVREFTGEFPAQMASNAENVSIWWRHHVQYPPEVVSKQRYRLTSITTPTVDTKTILGPSYTIHSWDFLHRTDVRYLCTEMGPWPRPSKLNMSVFHNTWWTGGFPLTKGQ